MASQQLGELVWKVTGDTKDIDKSLKGTESNISKVGKAFVAAFSAAAVIAGVRKIAQYLGQASEAAAIQESAVVRLGAALEATGQSTETALSEMQAFASAMQRVTVVGDEVSLGLLQTATNMGLNSGEAQAATQQAIALSRAYGIDLNTALIGVVNTMQGQTSTLTRYIPSLKAAGDETERMAILNAEAARAWEVATAEVNTAAGAQEQLRNATGDLNEAIGNNVNQVLTPFRQRMLTVVQGITEWINKQNELNDIYDALSGEGAIEDVAAAQARLRGELNDTYDALVQQNEQLARGTGMSAREFTDTVIAQAEAEGVLARETDGLYYSYQQLKQALSDLEFQQNRQLTVEEILTQGRVNAALAAADLAESERLAAQEAERRQREEEERLAAVASAQDYLRENAIANAEARQQAELSANAAIAMAELERIEDIALAEAALEAQRKQALEAYKSVSMSVYNSLQGAIGAFFDYQLSRAEEGSEQEKRIKRQQFNFNKLFSATNAGIAGAQAAVEAYKALAGIPYVGPALGVAAAAAVGTFTAAQVGFILGQQPPGFAAGGIVPGMATTGDTVDARVNSGEMILTQQQQAELFKLANGAGGSGLVKITVNLGEDALIKTTQSLMNRREIVINAGDIS